MWPGEMLAMLILVVGKLDHYYYPGSSTPLFLLLMGMPVETFCLLERERGRERYIKIKMFVFGL